jgi:hypothetical protein
MSHSDYTKEQIQDLRFKTEIVAPVLIEELQNARSKIKEIYDLCHLSASKSHLGYAGGILAKDIVDICESVLRTDSATELENG